MLLDSCFDEGVDNLSSPQAVTAWAAAEIAICFRLMAALTSLSRTVPHAEHFHDLTSRGNFSTMLLHVEQVFDEGKKRSAITTSPPARAVLYVNCLRISAKAASRTDFANLPPDLQQALISLIGPDLFSQFAFELGQFTPTGRRTAIAGPIGLAA